MSSNSNINEIKKRKALFSAKVIPWFEGFSDDLIFYIAINTLFLTIVKNFSSSQISLFTSVPCLCYIVLQPIFLKIIKKIGNKKSVIIGCLMLLLGSIIITFAKSFYIVMIGQILYTLAFLFKTMDTVMLKNNLIYLNKENEYVSYANKASIIYSISTTIIALFSGYLFKLNNYLPMYCGILICLVNLIISFMLDEQIIDNNFTDERNQNEKVKVSKIILLIMISYGLFYSTIGRGQANSKLLIQYSLNEYFDVGKTAIYFSYILVLSRITRVLASLLFNKIYSKLKEKMGYYLTIICSNAFLFIILGYFIPNIIFKFTLMSLGFCLILGIRDIFRTYSKDLVLKNSKVSEQQTFISYLGLARKIGETILSFGFSMVLLKFELIHVIFILLILSGISFMVNYKLYKKLN